MTTYYCPLCKKPLRSRLAEVAHYRAHARRGQLLALEWDPDGYSFAFTASDGRQDTRYRPFAHGFQIGRSQTIEAAHATFMWRADRQENPSR